MLFRSLRLAAPRRMTALVEVSENQMKIMGGGGQSCACGVESDLLAYLPVSFTQTWFKRVYYWTFPITLYAGLSELFMEVTLFIKLSSSCWHLRICSQCFQHVILHEGLARSCRINSCHIMRGARGICQGSNVYHNITIIVLYGIHEFSFNVFFL